MTSFTVIVTLALAVPTVGMSKVIYNHYFTLIRRTECDRKSAGRQDLKRTVTCERRASDNDQDTCKSVSSKLISKF